MPLPSLAQAIASVGGDRGRAAALARTAVEEVCRRHADACSFISVMDGFAGETGTASDALLGCVFSVKDNIDVAGLPTTCGSRLFEDFRPASDAWVVQALRAAGAQCIGKNNMHELALGATGVNERFGTTRNPWDASRTAGGSSGGSGVAVALRQVHLSIGTDSGGSVRIPASLCGVVGFKPTPGVLSLDGVQGAAWSIDCLGLFTAEMHDMIRVWDAIVPGRRPKRRAKLRLAYLHDDSMGRVNARVWERYRASIDSLRRSGVELTGISISGFQVAPYVCISVVYPEIASMHYYLVRQHPELYSPDIRALVYLGELWSARNYLDAHRLRRVLQDRYREILAPHDAILTPTAAMQAPRFGEQARVEGDPPGSELYTFMRFTVALNAIGYPAISVPAGLDSDSLPVGLQAIGRPGEDRALLDVAQRLEDVLGIMPAPPSA